MKKIKSWPITTAEVIGTTSREYGHSNLASIDERIPFEKGSSVQILYDPKNCSKRCFIYNRGDALFHLAETHHSITLLQ